MFRVLFLKKFGAVLSDFFHPKLLKVFQRRNFSKLFKKLWLWLWTFAVIELESHSKFITDHSRTPLSLSLLSRIGKDRIFKIQKVLTFQFEGSQRSWNKV